MRCDRLRGVLVDAVAGLIVLPAVLFAQSPFPEAPGEGVFSHARIVRLSYVNGSVSVKLPDSGEWEKGVVNTPLQEGAEIATTDNSYAEVEFENSSTIRLGELSRLSFEQLALDAQGDKLNRLAFERGYATFHFLPEHHDVYSVTIADATLTPEGKSEFRADVIPGRVRVEVFHGAVRVATPLHSLKLGEDKALEFSPGAGQEAFQTRNGIVADDWDKWVEARDAQAQEALRDESVKAQQGLYGWSDLDAYGEWVDIPGSGYGWAPYAPVGWMPFSSGLWNWYPALGWTWISSEPWGWLPYHCGLWSFDNTMGWFWMPQGGYGYWNPALVWWFQGPGWIGWCPRGAHGIPGSHPIPARPSPGHRHGFEPLGTHGVITVRASVFHDREMITPAMVHHLEPSEGAFMQHAPPRPGAVAMPSSGLRVNAATSSKVFATPAPEVHSRASPYRVTPRAGFRNASAPPTVLMGGNASTESALFQMSERGASRQPLHVVMGPTLGGRFVMLANPGEFRGSAFNGPVNYGWSSVVVLPHGHRGSPHLRAGGLISGGHMGHFGRGGKGGWHGGHFGGGHSRGGHSGGGHFGGFGHGGGGGGHGGGGHGGGGHGGGTR